MDNDEDMLDWGAHDDDEGAQLHSQHTPGIVVQERAATKDEATLSGAESLLALASGGVDPQDDKDSDVVSLGGGEDDMEELYAYQSRTHLGGVASGDVKPDEPALRPSRAKEEADMEDRKSVKTHAASTSSVAPKNYKNLSNDPVSDTSRPRSKPNSQPKPSRENIRSPSTTRLAPPTGPLGLPPKPVAAPTTPYIRPSHPSIMSASSMAAPPRERDRDLQRDHHDVTKGKHGSHSHASPESDVSPLAPGWETRRARDGSQDMYYYNTKTLQSTWSRSIATGKSSYKPEGSASPVYGRGRVKEQFPSSVLESPVARDITHPAGHDIGSQPRTRPTRFDPPIRTEPIAPSTTPGLTFEERHYRPNDDRSPERSQPFGNGDLRLQHQARGTTDATSMNRDQSPANHPTHPTLRRGNDADFQPTDRVQSRHRDERELPPYGDRAPGRNGERRIERSRSRSPGRSRHVWPNELVSNPWVRDAAVLPSNERRAPASMEGPRPPYGDSSPPLLYRGAQPPRSSSVGREDRSRYAPPPNHDQSSSRDRHRSPPPPERPRKRTRSKSPDFNNVNQRQAFRPSQSQPLRSNQRWNGFDPNQARQHDQTTQFDRQTRDRPPHQFEKPTMLPSTDPNQARQHDQTAQFDRQVRDRPPHQFEKPTIHASTSYTDNVRNGSGDRGFDRENDAKRQKVFDNSDSTGTRRPHSDGYGDRDTRLGDAPRRKRQPLPPQSERFKEVAAGPPAPTLPPPRHVTNGPLPSVTPSGPRRLPPREVNPIDSVQQGSVRAISQRKDFEDIRGQVGNSSQTRAFETNVGFAEGKHYEERGRPRQWDRERERAFPAELPTGPRAMDLDAEPPVFARRGRSPMRQHRDAYEDASPPPHLPTSGPRHSDRREHFASGGLKHSFTATDRAHREQQGRSRLAENQEFSHSQPARPDSLPSQTRFQQPQPSRLAFSSKPSSTNQLPAATNKLGTAGQSIEASSKRHGGEYPLRGPSPPQSTNDPSLHAREHGGRRSRSPKAVGLSVDTDRNDLRHERSLVTRGDDAELRSEAKGIIEAQPRGQSRFSDMDPERSNTLLNTSRPSSPPGARAIRIRRPSKLPDSTSSIEHRPPAGRGQPQPNRPHRQGSLLDRLSNPSVPGVTPPLRDRVSSPGENWKRGGTGPQSGPGTSLRDRLEGVGDARHARNIEWDQPFEDPTNGSNRRDRQNRRGGLGRGGRGQ